MAIKQVPQKVCDYCDREAMPEPCFVCKKDICYNHGACYRPHARGDGRPDEFLICDDCLKSFKPPQTKVESRTVDTKRYGILSELRKRVGID